MRRSLWQIPVVGLAVASLGFVGGTAIGGEMGPLTAGYGLLVGLAALYAVAGLAIRDRAWRRLPRLRGSSAPKTVAGHRMF
jgi:hypothetical protein